MTCNSCHKSEKLGAFNWPMDQTLIYSFISGGRMPYGQHLKELERDDLYEKLVEEYFAVDAANPGILKAWLLGQRR